MKSVTILAVMSLTLSIGCAKSDGPSAAPGPSSASGTNSPACTTITSTANDAQALTDIAKMTRQQCEQNFQQLESFYQATQGMTEAQQQAYFQQMTQGIVPQPPPPPPMCSVPYEALLKCASGGQ